MTDPNPAVFTWTRYEIDRTGTDRGSGPLEEKDREGHHKHGNSVRSCSDDTKEPHLEERTRDGE